MVEAKIRSAGLSDVYGAFGAENVQGEQQQKLDVYANQALLHCLGLRDSVAALVSEEDEEPVTFNRDRGDGEVHYRVRSAGWVFEYRCECECGDDLQRAAAAAGGAGDAGRVGAAAGIAAGGGGVCGVWAVDGAGIYDGQRRARIYAGPCDRGVCAEQ